MCLASSQNPLPSLSSFLPQLVAPNASRLLGFCADGDAQSYWASGPDPASRVDVQLDFSAAKQIKAVEIDWEHPAQVCAFSLSVLACITVFAYLA